MVTTVRQRRRQLATFYSCRPSDTTRRGLATRHGPCEVPGASPNVSTDAREDGPKEGKTYRDSVSGLKILFITRRLLHLLDLPISRKDPFLGAHVDK